ncbi:hypothetical protein [Timonella sp. A28]|uniref:hypothetical protein n=1 Tax=Timonella sp. A28 TaxID=3442640 RepID=UPI003EB73B54
MASCDAFALESVVFTAHLLMKLGTIVFGEFERFYRTALLILYQKRHIGRYSIPENLLILACKHRLRAAWEQIRSDKR